MNEHNISFSRSSSTLSNAVLKSLDGHRHALRYGIVTSGGTGVEPARPAMGTSMRREPTARYHVCSVGSAAPPAHHHAGECGAALAPRTRPHALAMQPAGARNNNAPSQCEPEPAGRASRSADEERSLTCDGRQRGPQPGQEAGAQAAQQAQQQRRAGQQRAPVLQRARRPPAARRAPPRAPRHAPPRRRARHAPRARQRCNAHRAPSHPIYSKGNTELEERSEAMFVTWHGVERRQQVGARVEGEPRVQRVQQRRHAPRGRQPRRPRAQRRARAARRRRPPPPVRHEHCATHAPAYYTILYHTILLYTYFAGAIQYRNPKWSVDDIKI